jgi:predicted dienelactone hydrolase
MLLAVAGCTRLPTPRPPPPGSESAARLAAGPYRVVAKRVVLHDRARDRTLASTVWWPAEGRGPAPLVVQAHGFLAHRGGGAYVARHLASRGYVVIAARHPHTTLFTVGGATVDDVVRQPGDVSFLIDRLLAADGAVRELPRIDPTRIAVMGHSLGGATATLAAFHPRLRDARIAAAISLAGPMAMFERGFFRAAELPFLMIAGTGDVIVDYRRNALLTLDRVPGATLLSIAGASHAGFDQATAGLARLLDNPDVLACWVLRRTLDLDLALRALRDFVRPGDDVGLEGGVRPPCGENPPDVAIDPVRQQTITSLAVTAFLDSCFAPDPATRMRARRYLTITLPADFAEVSVATAEPVHRDDGVSSSRR